MGPAHLLIFVEDPGAANFVAGLPGALAEKGWRTTLLTGGFAEGYLRERRVSVQAFPHDATVRAVLERVDPRLVLLAPSDDVDTKSYELIAQARWAGIESVGIVDFWGTPDMRYRGPGDTPLSYAPDWLLLPDEQAKKTFVGFGYPEERTTVSGHPHFDYVRSNAARLAREDRQALRQRLFPAADRTENVVVFLAEPLTGRLTPLFQRSPDFTLFGRGQSSDRTKIVLEEFLDAATLASPRPHLVLRLHPKTPHEELCSYFSEFDQISRDGPAISVVHAADRVVGMTSIVLLEAAIVGRPTFSIIPRQMEKDWMPSIRMGITQCATTREQVRTTFVDWLNEEVPEAPEVDREGLFAPGSLGRASDFIHALLERGGKPTAASNHR